MIALLTLLLAAGAGCAGLLGGAGEAETGVLCVQVRAVTDVHHPVTIEVADSALVYVEGQSFIANEVGEACRVLEYGGYEVWALWETSDWEDGTFVGEHEHAVVAPSDTTWLELVLTYHSDIGGPE